MKKIILACSSMLVLTTMLTACGETSNKTADSSKEKSVEKKVAIKQDERKYYEQKWSNEWNGLKTNANHVTVVKLSDTSKEKMKIKDDGVIGVKLHFENTSDKDIFANFEDAKLVVNGKQYAISKEDSVNIDSKIAKKSKKDVLLNYHIPKMKTVNDFDKVNLEWKISSEKVNSKMNDQNSKTYDVALQLKAK